MHTCHHRSHLGRLSGLHSEMAWGLGPQKHVTPSSLNPLTTETTGSVPRCGQAKRNLHFFRERSSPGLGALTYRGKGSGSLGFPTCDIGMQVSVDSWPATEASRVFGALTAPRDPRVSSAWPCPAGPLLCLPRRLSCLLPVGSSPRQG